MQHITRITPHEHSRLLVSDGLVTGPIHDLPGVGDEAGDGHPVGLIDAVNSAVAGGEEHLVQDGLLDRQDDPVPALEAEGRAAVLDGLGGVLHLENAPIRRERRGGKVVSAACRHDWLLRAGGGSCACSTGAGAGDTSARTLRSKLKMKSSSPWMKKDRNGGSQSSESKDLHNNDRPTHSRID